MKKNSANGVLSVTINGKTENIAELDLRKLEMINYYLQQTEKGKNTDIVALVAESAKATVDSAVDKLYKKYVPSSVRNMYDNFLSKSAAFGGADLDKQKRYDETN